MLNQSKLSRIGKKVTLGCLKYPSMQKKRRNKDLIVKIRFKGKGRWDKNEFFTEEKSNKAKKCFFNTPFSSYFKTSVIKKKLKN